MKAHRILFFLLCISFLSSSSYALTFTKLSGIAGGSIKGTAVYRADLTTSGITDLLSIIITDNSNETGGAVGQFSGFDLDAIVLSYDLVTDVTGLAGMTLQNVLNYSTANFTKGTQRAPADPKLFGTDATGNNVDNSVATLGLFDGESTTLTPDGFISMGDGGSLALNLTSSLQTTGLYLYLGEVGDNGELIDGSVRVSDRKTNVPDSGQTLLLLMGSLAIVAGARRIKDRN